MNDIVQIDLKKFDAETENLQKQSDDLLSKIANRIEIRSHILSISTPLAASRINASRAANNQPGLNFNVTDLNTAKRPRVRGLSQFIFSSLAKGNKSTPEVVTEYANSLNQNYDDVNKVVSKTLSKLKETGKLEYIGQRRSGVWSIVNKE